MGKQNKGILGKIESVGNKLPHPIYIFMILAVAVMIISALMSGTTVTHPGTGESETIKSLLSRDGIVWILGNMVKNFINFPPLGMVLVMMIGLGLAEETGLLRTVLRTTIVGAPKTLVTFIVIFSGVLGNIAGSATFVVIPPLGGLIFKALGRHPIAGIAAGFGGVAAGLSANLLVTPTDVLLAGLSEKAAQIIDPTAVVHPAVNWYFMIASTFVLSIVGTIVIEKVVEKRLGKYNPSEGQDSEGEDEKLMTISKEEKKGLRNAGIATLVYIVVILALTVPQNAILRDPETGGLIPSPFLSSMIPILLIWFVVAALAFGFTAGTIKNSSDIEKHMTNSMKGFASFIVLCFFAAQFVEFFSYSNLGLLLSVKGAGFFSATGINGIPLVVGFILFVACINFLMGSSSAKWALLAPIFIPMFMQLGLSPAYTQAAYRIADSVTNCVSPLEPFLPFIIICCQKYNKKAGLGTVISAMAPIAVSFLVSWTLLLIVWTLLRLPLGPGAYIGM